MTKQRREIYSVIMGSPLHMTADEIFEAVRLRIPSIARATVYRNLGLMEQDGQIRRLRIAGHPDRFDRSTMTHEHIRCPKCGALEDVVLPWLKDRLEGELGRSVLSVHLDIAALCSRCAACGKAGDDEQA